MHYSVILSILSMDELELNIVVDLLLYTCPMVTAIKASLLLTSV